MKINMIRFIACFGVLLVGMFSSLMLFLIAAFIYAISFASLELIIIAGAIDAYYGLTTDQWPLSTLSVLVVVILVEWIRPHISLYNE